MRVHALIGLVLLSVASMTAQQSVATVTGRMIDPHGDPVTNTAASIHAKNTASGAEFTAAIADSGEFRLTGLPPGTYDISVPLLSAMFWPYSEKGVVVRAGENTIDVNLKWGVNLGTFADDPAQLANDMRARNPVREGPTPRMPDGKVDFSGMWVAMTQTSKPAPITYKPWAAEIDKKLKALGGDNRPDVFCLPFSALPFDAAWFPHKLAQTPTLLVDIAEFDTPGYRQIFLDGRPHPDPERWNPSWLGHSVGKWEGDTLVIDTVGFNEKAGGVGVHTEKLHIVERLRRPDLSHLIVDMWVNDPEAYEKPWTKSITFQLAPNEEIMEFICAENNQTPLHLEGGRSGYRHRP